MIQLFNFITSCFKKKKKDNHNIIATNIIPILETNFKPCEVYFIDYDEISDLSI